MHIPPTHPKSFRLLAIGASLFAFGAAGAQTVPAAAADSDLVQLSPFLVSSAGDEGYRAANTLAGTRMNTSLFLTPAAISVLTKDLLDDLGATKTEDFVRFAVSTDIDAAKDGNANGSQWYDAPVKIRGFSGATVTRDYFPWSLSSDTYNVDRVELNRGPNAVLYGVGAPGGVLNTSSKQAQLNGRKKSASLTFGSWEKKRAELDLAVPVVRDTLALRVNTLVEDRKGWRDFEFSQQRGVALAGTYAPFRSTTIRTGYERMIREQLVPTGTPNDNGGTRWLAAGAPLAPNPLSGANPNPGLLRFRTIESVYYAPQLRAAPFRLSTIGADVRPDLAGVQAPGYWDTVLGPVTLSKGTVDDPYLGQLIPLRSNLNGPGSTTNSDYTVYQAFVEQRLGGFALELGFRRRTYWRDNRIITADGVSGDANPVLPGAYLADGDSRLAAGRLPGTLLSDIGAPNPYAGRLYVEGQAQTRPFDEHADQYRAALGYELDLSRRSAWLGKHTLSGMWQLEHTLNGTWVEREYNLTPANNQPIDSTTNNIIRRTYLDFSTPGGLHGAMDPWATPIRAPGVTSGYAYVGPTQWRRLANESRMLAGQSRFFSDRLVFTAGYREDKVTGAFATSGGVRLPNSTNLYSKLDDIFGPADNFKGNTHTLGVFAAPVRFVGVTYNQSNSVLPETNVNPYNKSWGTRRGEGQDYGLRFNLVENRLYLSVNRFQTDDKNSRTGVFLQQQLGLTPVISAILDTLLFLRQPLPASMVAAGVTTWSGGTGMTVDSKGKGTELELTGRLTPGWSLSLNASETKLALGNISPFYNAFFDETKPAWDGNATRLLDTPGTVQTYVRTRDNTPARDFVLNPATINDAYDFAALMRDEINRSDGQQPLQHTERSVNIFTSYRFTEAAARFLKGGRVGAGANYRSAPVIGYDAANNNAPIRGDTTLLVNLMLGKTFPLGRGESFDVQLNLQNLLGAEAMIPFAASTPGQVLVYSYPRLRRTWDLRASYRF